MSERDRKRVRGALRKFMHGKMGGAARCMLALDFFILKQMKKRSKRIRE